VGASPKAAGGRCKLVQRMRAIHKPAPLLVTTYWLDIKLHRGPDIGYVQHAEAIKVGVEGGTRYTSDLGAFLAAEAKVRDQFEGNVVDIGGFRPFSFLPRLMKTTLIRIEIYS
jgi:hypothetical protein